jgi:hypothetical protein
MKFLKQLLFTVPWREQISVEDCELSGHPSTGCTDRNIRKVWKIDSKDQQSTILEIAGKLDLLYGTC